MGLRKPTQAAVEDATASYGGASETGNLSIATSRYQSQNLIIESGLAPVRTTLYPPRFPLGYELAGKLDALAPRRPIFRLAGDEFEEAYRKQLDLESVERLRMSFHELADHADAPGVVLLCFESSVPVRGVRAG